MTGVTTTESRGAVARRPLPYVLKENLMVISCDAESFSAFFSQVDASAPCWVWGGRTTKKGYGIFRTGGREVRAHRWSWEALIGPIPQGRALDHLCRNHPCVNPDHLEPVTWAENTRRGPVPKRNAAREHCPAGHPYSPENTVTYEGSRKCRACGVTHGRNHRARLKPALGAIRSVCWLGHALTPENTVTLADGYLVCRECLDKWTNPS